MLIASSASSDVYKRAFSQFMTEVRFYLGDAQAYINDLTVGERLLALCAFIMLLMYLIVSRARKKYNPGSHGRQFAGALVLVLVVVLGAGWTFNSGEGMLSYLFSI